MEPRAKIGSILDTCLRGSPLIQLMGYERLEDAVAGGGSRQRQTHTHTQCPRNTQDGWSHRQ